MGRSVVRQAQIRDKAWQGKTFQPHDIASRVVQYVLLDKEERTASYCTPQLSAKITMLCFVARTCSLIERWWPDL
jgi:hypothetical protein